MGIVDSETVRARCKWSDTLFDLHAADTDGSGLDDRAGEQVNWRCEACGYEWPEAAPDPRKRDLPAWAIVEGAH
jgi:hypothetical protein